MADQTVYVLVYSHKHGEDVTVYATREGAHAGAAGIAREWWPEIRGEDGVPDSPAGLTDEEVTRIYFDRMGDEESCEITQSAVFD